MVARARTRQQKRVGRKPVPKNETRHEKFVRLAIDRVERACEHIRYIGNLSGVNYAFTADEIEKIRATLHAAVESELERFAPRLTERPERPKFSL